MADGINLHLGRPDMNTFRTVDRPGRRVVVHVAGKHPVALCPSCEHPSVDTNGTGWRDVIARRGRLPSPPLSDTR